MIQDRQLVVRDLESGRREIFAEVADRRRAGDEQDVFRATQKPREGHLHRGCVEIFRDARERVGLQWRKATEREERHVRDAGCGELVDHRVIVAMRDIIQVLHADDRCDATTIGDLLGRHIAEPDVTHEALALQRDLLCDELKNAAVKVARVDKYLKTISDKHPGVTLLRTIPGIGPRTAEALLAYIDDIKRFGRIKSLGCYFGLVPCQDATGDKNRLGHITRDGPATVRKLLGEASWTAVRRSPGIRRISRRCLVS